MTRKLQTIPTLVTPMSAKKQAKQDKKTVDLKLKKLSGFNPPGGNEEVPMVTIKLASKKRPHPSSTTTSTTSTTTGTRKSQRLTKK
jgi:hypothetical protein